MMRGHERSVHGQLDPSRSKRPCTPVLQRTRGRDPSQTRNLPHRQVPEETVVGDGDVLLNKRRKGCRGKLGVGCQKNVATSTVPIQCLRGKAAPHLYKASPEVAPKLFACHTWPVGSGYTAAVLQAISVHDGVARPAINTCSQFPTD